jgi:predicted AAA+ superfamily ATPase
MVIKRDFYVDKLMAVRHNGLVKVITGVRRCGKSYLLFNLYRDALNAEGLGDDHFVCAQLDDDDSEGLRTPRALSQWIKARIEEASRPTVEKKRREIDFVVNNGMKKLYIQSALTISPDGKLEQETASLRRTGDFFRKIVVVGGSQQPRLDEEGILYVGVVPFLVDTSILDSII